MGGRRGGVEGPGVEREGAREGQDTGHGAITGGLLVDLVLGLVQLRKEEYHLGIA